LRRLRRRLSESVSACGRRRSLSFRFRGGPASFERVYAPVEARIGIPGRLSHEEQRFRSARGGLCSIGAARVSGGRYGRHVPVFGRSLRGNVHVLCQCHRHTGQGQQTDVTGLGLQRLHREHPAGEFQQGAIRRGLLRRCVSCPQRGVERRQPHLRSCSGHRLPVWSAGPTGGAGGCGRPNVQRSGGQTGGRRTGGFGRRGQCGTVFHGPRNLERNQARVCGIQRRGGGVPEPATGRVLDLRGISQCGRDRSRASNGCEIDQYVRRRIGSGLLREVPVLHPSRDPRGDLPGTGSGCGDVSGFHHLGRPRERPGRRGV